MDDQTQIGLIGRLEEVGVHAGRKVPLQRYFLLAMEHDHSIKVNLVLLIHHIAPAQAARAFILFKQVLLVKAFQALDGVRWQGLENLNLFVYD